MRLVVVRVDMVAAAADSSCQVAPNPTPLSAQLGTLIAVEERAAAPSLISRPPCPAPPRPATTSGGVIARARTSSLTLRSASAAARRAGHAALAVRLRCRPRRRRRAARSVALSHPGRAEGAWSTVSPTWASFALAARSWGAAPQWSPGCVGPVMRAAPAYLSEVCPDVAALLPPAVKRRSRPQQLACLRPRMRRSGPAASHPRAGPSWAPQTEPVACPSGAAS